MSIDMAQARTVLMDLQFDRRTLSNPGKISAIVQAIEEALQPSSLKRKYEGTIGETYIVLFSNESGSLSCMFKSYPFGLATLAVDDALEGKEAFSNMNGENLRRALAKKLKAKIGKECPNFRVTRLPFIRRGTKVPVFYTTSDERVLEYNFDKLVYEEDSPYQNIRILNSPSMGNCLMLDDAQNLGDCDISYTHGVMKYGTISYTGKDVLILGGGDGGLLHEILKENPKFVTMVDIDRMVVDAARIHLRKCCGDSLDKLEGPNHHVIIDDCLKKLDEFKLSGRKFDVIINDLTDLPISPTPQGEVWDFILGILKKSLLVLKENGSYLNHALGESCSEALKVYEKLLGTLPVKVTFQRHAAYVPSFMENWVFYEIKKV